MTCSRLARANSRALRLTSRRTPSGESTPRNWNACSKTARKCASRSRRASCDALRSVTSKPVQTTYSTARSSPRTASSLHAMRCRLPSFATQCCSRSFGNWLAPSRAKAASTVSASSGVRRKSQGRLPFTSSQEKPVTRSQASLNRTMRPSRSTTTTSAATFLRTVSLRSVQRATSGSPARDLPARRAPDPRSLFGAPIRARDLGWKLGRKLPRAGRGAQRRRRRGQAPENEQTFSAQHPIRGSAQRSRRIAATAPAPRFAGSVRPARARGSSARWAARRRRRRAAAALRPARRRRGPCRRRAARRTGSSRRAASSPRSG